MNSDNTGNFNQSKKNTQKSKIFDPFAGGRFLRAIAENQNLTSDETLILLIIGSIQDFRDFEHSKKFIKVERLCQLSKRSERKVQYVLKSLDQKKYLIREECYASTGRQMITNYSLADLIFEEARLKWEEEKSKENSESGEGQQESSANFEGAQHAPHATFEGAQHAPPGVHSMHPLIPNKEIPNESHNNKLLCGDGAEAPTKQGKSKKTGPKERSRKLFRLAYRRVRQPREPAELFVPFTTNEQLDTVFDRLYGKYPAEAFSELYSAFEAAGVLGAFDWNPNRPERDLEAVMADIKARKEEEALNG